MCTTLEVRPPKNETGCELISPYREECKKSMKAMKIHCIFAKHLFFCGALVQENLKTE